MRTYWANVRTTVGGFIKVDIQAPNPFMAREMLGDRRMSDFASLVI